MREIKTEKHKSVKCQMLFGDRDENVIFEFPPYVSIDIVYIQLRGCWKEVGSCAELRGTLVGAHEGLAYI